MARPKGSTRTPTYRLVKRTKQAVTTIAGHDHYLGDYGSPESRLKYDRLIGEFLSQGRVISGRALLTGQTITEIIAQYWRYCESYYKVQSLRSIRTALKLLNERYGPTPVGEMKPLMIVALRDAMITRKVTRWNPRKRVYFELPRTMARKTINAYIVQHKLLFKWASANSLVSSEVAMAIMNIKRLKPGRSKARDTARVLPVEDHIVDATLPYMSNVHAAMARVQRLTGMRSGECCIMRACDIDMSNVGTWRYRPADHKSAHHGHDRVVIIGPQAQDIIRPFFKSDLRAYLFTPAESFASLRDQRRQRRRRERHAEQTERNAAGDKTRIRFVTDEDYEKERAAQARKRRRKGLPVRNFAAHVTPVQYANGIANAIREANADRLKSGHEPIPAWHSHQTRHTFATNLRAAGGLSLVSTSLGHQHDDTTEIYAERDYEAVAKLLAEVG